MVVFGLFSQKFGFATQKCQEQSSVQAEITESVGTYELKVARQSGARGTVAIPFTTEEGTAKAGKDYEHVEGELLFNNEENA